MANDIVCEISSENELICEMSSAGEIVVEINAMTYWMPNEELALRASVEDVALKADKTYVDSQVDAVSGEVILARGTAETLSARLNASDVQLGQKANQSDLEITNSNLTLKAEISYVDTKIQQVSNGAPKGTYLTLASLENALPSGDTGNYLVVENGHIYTWDGASWVDTGILYQAVGIADKSIGIEKLSNTKVFKNLYDKTKITQGIYVDHYTGAFGEVAGYNASDFIPLVSGLTYSKNAPYQFAYYTESKEYISGVGDGVYTFTVPANVVYGRFTLKDENIESFQIEYGTRITNPSEYTNVFDIQVLPRQDNTYKVSRVGGNFENIYGGIGYLKSLGLIEPVTMLIYPGIYEENIVSLKGDNKISLVGINKRDTIIIDKTGDYYKCPLQIAGENYISNLTVIANHDSVAVIPPITSYALHSDYNYTGTTLVENCTFESYQNAAVGLGLFSGQKIEFRNCKLYSDSLYNGGSLYFHNAVASGGTPMELLLVNCEIISKTGHALVMDDANIGSGDGLGNDMTVTFINCFVWSEELGKNCVRTNVPPNNETCVAGNVKLGTKSSGNNLEELNA